MLRYLFPRPEILENSWKHRTLVWMSTRSIWAAKCKILKLSLSLAPVPILRNAKCLSVAESTWRGQCGSAETRLQHHWKLHVLCAVVHTSPWFCARFYVGWPRVAHTLFSYIPGTVMAMEAAISMVLLQLMAQSCTPCTTRSVQNRIQITELYAYLHTNTFSSGAAVTFKLIHIVSFMHHASCREVETGRGELWG